MRFWKVVDITTKEKTLELFYKITKGDIHNLNIWKEKFPLEFSKYYRTSGFNLCYEVEGVVLDDDKLEIPEGWVKSKGGSIVPNNRTKLGKEIKKYLNEHKTIVNFSEIFDLCESDYLIGVNFLLPQIFLSKSLDEVYIKNDLNLKDNPKFEEVTRSYVEDMI